MHYNILLQVKLNMTPTYFTGIFPINRVGFVMHT